MKPSTSTLVGGCSLVAVIATAILVPRPPEGLPPATEEVPPNDQDLPAIHVRTADELETLFEQAGFEWPLGPGGVIPNIEVSALPLDLDRLPTYRRKALFFRALLPVIMVESAHLLRQRAEVAALFGKPAMKRSLEDWIRMKAWTRRYRVKGDPNDPAVREKLLRRIDVVPPGLVLAQAAIESGWGTSRFAQNANNLFGVWTYRKGAGLAPTARAEGARHSVRFYQDIRSAVQSYLFNLNTGHAYDALRRLRAEMRMRGEPFDASMLAGELSRYSQRGEAYVEEVRHLIRANQLDQLSGIRLERVDIEAAATVHPPQS